MKKDGVLVVWILCAFMWDIFLIGGTSYLVFYKGCSGWWFVLTVLLGSQFTLFDVLKERYGINEK